MGEDDRGSEVKEISSNSPSENITWHVRPSRADSIGPNMALVKKTTPPSVPGLPPPLTTTSPTANTSEKQAPFCMLMASHCTNALQIEFETACQLGVNPLSQDGAHQSALADAFIRDTIEALPVKPDRISDVHGPYLEVSRVADDATALNVQVTHHFRAHFGAVLTSGATAIEHATIAVPIEALDPSISPPISTVAPRIEEVHIDELHPGIGGTTVGQPPIIRNLSSSSGRSPESSFAHDLQEVALRDVDSSNKADLQIAVRNGGPQWLQGSGGGVRPASTLWEIDPSSVHIGHRLAVGGFAEVFLGKFHGTLVAVKLLLNVDAAARERFLKEVALMASLRHPNLLLFMGYVTHPRLAIVSEYMQRGSLYRILRKGGDVPLEPRLQRTVAVGVARGMQYLHSRAPPLIHLDLKSPNILVDERWRVKIADFGLSRVRFNTFLSGAGAGTPEWMAPEVLRSDRHDEKADVYSYGVVLWELLTGQPPWDGLHPMQVVGAVGFQGRSLQAPEEGDPFLVDLCVQCMARMPDERPSFVEILELLEAAYAPAQVNSMRSTLSESDVGRSATSAEESVPPESRAAILLGPSPVARARMLLLEAPPPPEAALQRHTHESLTAVSPFAVVQDHIEGVIEGDVTQPPSEGPSSPGGIAHAPGSHGSGFTATLDQRFSLDTPFANLDPFSDDDGDGSLQNSDRNEGTGRLNSCEAGTEDVLPVDAKGGANRLRVTSSQVTDATEDSCFGSPARVEILSGVSVRSTLDDVCKLDRSNTYSKHVDESVAAVEEVTAAFDSAQL